MKRLLFLLTSLLFINCSKNPETFIKHLNGYWEIEEVTLNDGSKKQYNYNDTIDYINVTDSLSGIRKKLKPNFEGTYKTSNNAENFKIVIENDSLNLYYSTPFTKWKETILNASQDQLLVINSNKDMYLYKRYQPIIIE
ncbi:hypothetical protein [Ichthyenterobacterium magnum]|uniref:Lipocalin-like protein n=1 Tax=Ichthyenterobacterium magnum TaxID=1230530 RepID=A0A420DGV1_9FLAO|nr:hypothetical protein [Ichthyenterobacterium magnum]RKE92315.1 hypothetical protein BXY80_2234 [Ichthyenterobacterium magnum]